MTCAYYTCGSCNAQEPISGLNRPDADHKANYYTASGRLCGACYAKKKSAERERSRQEAEAAATKLEIENNLPELKGSKKQIAWARTIRAAQYQLLHDAVPRAITPKIEAYFRDEMAVWMEETSAHRWIERRDIDVGGRWLSERVFARGLQDRVVAEQIRIAMVAMKMHVCEKEVKS